MPKPSSPQIPQFPNPSSVYPISSSLTKTASFFSCPSLYRISSLTSPVTQHKNVFRSNCVPVHAGACGYTLADKRARMLPGARLLRLGAFPSAAPSTRSENRPPFPMKKYPRPLNAIRKASTFPYEKIPRHRAAPERTEFGRERNDEARLLLLFTTPAGAGMPRGKKRN